MVVSERILSASKKKMEMKFIAIDTGFNQGGVLFWDGGPQERFRISKMDWLVFQSLACDYNCPMFVETPLFMPAHGKKTVMSVGRGYGRLEMVSMLCKIPFVTIHPKTWQTKLGIKRDGRNYKEHKEYLYQLACEEFPDEIFSKEVGDAFLMAKYIDLNYTICGVCKGSGYQVKGDKVIDCKTCKGSGVQ